ncbi:MAG: response regulator [Armatimonadota bacterium]|nr:response regulator [Armatimonadota bacterium]
MANILVIEDENNIRMMIRLALQQFGHVIDTGVDGPDGLAKFGNGDGWDLVLLDQRMPGMEGLEVLRLIRQRAPRARVIMVTAFGTIDLAVDAMKAGAKDFLRKPFTANVLRGAVQAALDTSFITEDSPSEARSADDGNSASTLTFSMSTVNGYWIDSQPGPGVKDAGNVCHTFSVRSPAGEVRKCHVTLPAYIIELVKAYTDREEMPGGHRFWQALCEEALANYVWQNADYPENDKLEVEGLTTSLKRWIDAVLQAGH